MAAELPEVLVIDDDHDLCISMGRYLGQRYRVATFTSATKALDHLHQHSARLLVVDLRMPGLNGFMLINEARELWPSIEVLLVSGYIDPDNAEERELYERYTPHCLKKPFIFPDLLATVDTILNEKGT